MVIKNIWQEIDLICKEHNAPITLQGVSYCCERKNQKEMCSINISVKTVEKLVYALSEAIIKQESEDIYGPLGNFEVTIKPYRFTLKPTDERYVFYVTDIRRTK